jgi:hypothetical protein
MGSIHDLLSLHRCQRKSTGPGCHFCQVVIVIDAQELLEVSLSGVFNETTGNVRSGNVPKTWLAKVSIVQYLWA